MEHDQIAFFASEGRIRAAAVCMLCVKCSCSELELAKQLHTFFIFDKKLKRPRSGFDLVAVLISEQGFFQHRVRPV